MASGRSKHAVVWAVLLTAALIGGCEEPVDPETDLDALHAAAQASGGDPWWLIAPPDSFRLGGSLYAETEIRLSWLWPDTADAVRVFRHIGPHSGEILQSCEPDCPYPYSVDWHNIGTVERDEEEWGSFSDGDLNPPIEDVTDPGLDGLYRYFLEAVVYDDATGQTVGSSRSEETPMISTHTRGMNAPFDVFLSATIEWDSHPGSATPMVRVYWTDMSRIEDHFAIFYFRSQDPADTVRLNAPGNSNCPAGPDDECRKYYNEDHPSFSDTYRVTDLEPDTEYCFLVRAEDHAGYSTSAFGDGEPSCTRTWPEYPPDDPDDPEDKTATVWLENEEIIKGGAAYRGQFGPITTGPPYLTKVENVSGRGLKFVKAGRNTDECDTNPSAVVALGPGEETTPSMLEEIWGTPMPALGPTNPLYFTACASGEVVNMIPIKISYRYMNSDGPPDTIPDR